ncbi:uncharacterized protein F4822DRAFT_195372 [Hypoxylon trugodes]|uniref:uncharacterized protein n=1 Tax=Hypoxylon trugodes TaxID=326681 RepID=UPI00218E86EF|nr:uncharacterized protein F4822DRAFT_195372 [Hypoxylon trugodes]KAI1389277.1 hypothetical protein F4822DRAFT_195372 [Hypoxylon trugodes]
MANPVGEDSWLAYVDEESRHANDLEARLNVVELFKNAVAAEPGSLKIWLAYCEWFWSLFTDCQSSEAGWSEEEQQRGRKHFSFDSALSLWSQGYEAIKYRINDSHEFWNRWVSIELEQLARTRTPVGVKRISHLFRDRLQVPHATWDDTSQMFSSFLSTYNNAAYETEFKEMTASAQEAKAAYEAREPYELKLNRAIKSGDDEAHKATMKDYLGWEIAQIKKKFRNPILSVSLCLGLFARALCGISAFDDEVWSDAAIYLSALQHHARTFQLPLPIPNLPDFYQRATSHCPWSGPLWSRYILTAEEAGWSFHSVESIKHAATNTKALDKNGMAGVLDMYTAWCGFLKRTAMDPNAPEDAADVAEVGLLAALEDVDLWGRRLYKDAYRGDPNYRLQRILIQFLTEVKGEIDDAREHWDNMADQSLTADSYDFWLNYYLWEMMIYASKPKPRSPTPATPVGGTKIRRVPGLATTILQRAIARPTLDWPERIMEVYLQHCNDYESPETLHHALDMVHTARQEVAKRREREQAAYQAQMQQAQQHVTHDPATENGVVPGSPSGSKRKREFTPDDTYQGVSKRVKSLEADGADRLANEQKLKRDRENTSVIVTNLPVDVTQTAIRKYFREYGHINNLDLRKEPDGESSTALIEFRSTEDVQSALLRDQKYFGQHQITVKPGTGLTLFVSNYPPTADETYIRSLFKDCGDVFAVRFPSLKFNTHRRFCYVSFRDQDSAYKATQLDGQLIEGKFKLQSKYSNPTHKKDREGAVAESREVRVKNVDSSANEDDLKDVFSKYGKVSTVRIVRNTGGKNVGTAYIVFETKEDAESALQLDKTKFKSQILLVDLSKETNFKPSAVSRGDRPSASPAPSGDGDVAMTDGNGEFHNGFQKPTSKEIQERTIAIMNVPDTVNDARVRAIVEKHGPIVKLILRPDHQGAIIEFADAATVGRAALGLEGYEIVPGRKVRTGTVRDLLQERSEKREDKIITGKRKAANHKGGSKEGRFMPPPQNIRRPVAGRGPKRGLGFVAPKKDASKNNHHTSETNGTGAAVKPKSNADFKALFLNPGNGESTANHQVNGTGRN